MVDTSCVCARVSLGLDGELHRVPQAVLSPYQRTLAGCDE